MVTPTMLRIFIGWRTFHETPFAVQFKEHFHSFTVVRASWDWDNIDLKWNLNMDSTRRAEYLHTKSLDIFYMYI